MKLLCNSSDLLYNDIFYKKRKSKMKMLALISIITLFHHPVLLFSQDSKMGIFGNNTDVGVVGKPGTVNYDPEKQQYLVEGSGTNIWFDNDEFQFVWKKVKGDFILRAHLNFIGDGLRDARFAIQRIILIFVSCIGIADGEEISSACSAKPARFERQWLPGF